MSDELSSFSEVSVIQFEAREFIDRARYSQARLLINRGLQLSPDDAELMYLSAFVDYVESHYDGALDKVGQLLSRDPDHYGGKRLLGKLLEEDKRYSEAETIWISLLKDYPEDADAYAAYARLMMQTMILDKAELLAREGLRYEPDHSECLFVLSLSQLAKGRGKKEHAATLQRLLKEHPEQFESSIALVISLIDQGNSKSALPIAQALLRSQPDSEELVNLVRSLRTTSHWSLLPLYPMLRWGWVGAAVVTVVGIFILQNLKNTLPEATYKTVQHIWLGYIIYSWIWPAILKKLIR
jgi:tetratricopeptide (TPR) repeat protein